MTCRALCTKTALLLVSLFEAVANKQQKDARNKKPQFFWMPALDFPGNRSPGEIVVADHPFLFPAKEL
jgi:hypothetical protein